MLEHTKCQVNMIKTIMFITAVCILFLFNKSHNTHNTKRATTHLQLPPWVRVRVKMNVA